MLIACTYFNSLPAYYCDCRLRNDGWLELVSDYVWNGVWDTFNNFSYFISSFSSGLVFLFILFFVGWMFIDIIGIDWPGQIKTLFLVFDDKNILHNKYRVLKSIALETKCV